MNAAYRYKPGQSHHTLGSWRIAMNLQTNTPELIRAFIFDKNGGEMHTVASVSCDETGDATANARLIAAAPDLLDLLYTVLPYIEDLELDQMYKPGVVAALTRRIRETLDKAEGVQS